jgi:hypothetical protein
VPAGICAMDFRCPSSDVSRRFERARVEPNEPIEAFES